MADIEINRHGQLPDTMQVKFRDLGDGNHAEVVAAVLVDENNRSFEIDEKVSAITTISVPHHEIHEGEMFISSYKSAEGADVADDGTLALLIRTSTKVCHFVFTATGGGDTEVELLENPTVSDAGTGLSEINLNRGSSETPGATTFHTPSITGGTLLFNTLVVGGQKNAASGGSLRPDVEWNLKTNEDYVVRATNRAGNAKPMSIIFEWYEEDA